MTTAPPSETPLDALVIGAGPAGLTAAIYLARFHLSVRMIDAGGSRAALIPRTRNHAGYPGGIPGRELIDRMAAQAREHSVTITPADVHALAVTDGIFTADATDCTIRARTVLLATGVVNIRPPIDDGDHRIALERGLLRYCPICDGFEVTDKRVGVIGTGDHGAAEARFLRGFTRDVTLISPAGVHDLSDEAAHDLAAIGVATANGPCGPLVIDGDRIVAPTPAGALAFDSIYPALGSHIRSELALAVGADANDEGCIVVDEHQRTSVPGLYAAGDVVKGLDQISNAMGQAGVAATTIRNDLAERAPLLR